MEGKILPALPAITHFHLPAYSATIDGSGPAERKGRMTIFSLSHYNVADRECQFLGGSVISLGMLLTTFDVQ